jgi:hypothetical protein
VGIYLSPEVRQYAIVKERQGEKRTYHLGESICYGVEEMAASMFAEVVLLDSPEVKGTDRPVHCILVASMSESDFLFPGNAFVDLRAIVAVKYTVLNPDGTVAWFDTYVGRGQEPMPKNQVWKVLIFPPWGFYALVKNEKRASEKCMRQALEDHFRLATNGMNRSEWWKPFCDKPAASPGQK